MAKGRDLIMNLPIKVGKDVWRGVLFEEETRIELGGINDPSTAFVVHDENVEMINDGTITLIGPDIQDIKKSTCSFGIIVIIGGNRIKPEHLNRIRSTFIISGEIEGFALSSSPRYKRFKVSKDVFERGVSFEHIGRAFMYLFQNSFPALIERIEIIFFSADTNSIRDLIEFEQRIKHYFSDAIREKIYNYAVKLGKIRDDCDLDIECDICENEPICIEIKEIIERREIKIKEKRLKED
ncbi:MAG: hypothetical protein ACFFCS_22210 [Candidatus Hodarchaeota archaeon]